MTTADAFLDKSLALFQNPQTDPGSQGTEWVTYRPVNQLTGGSAIEFTIPPMANTYLDLQSTTHSIFSSGLERTATAHERSRIMLPLQGLFGRPIEYGRRGGIVQSTLLDGKNVELLGRLQLDLCQQDRWLLNGLPIHLKLWQTRDAFRLLTEDESTQYKMKIEDASLRVATVKIDHRSRCHRGSRGCPEKRKRRTIPFR
ncbi:hypothetical protein BOW39_13150 [Solemya velum gill symbiont]|nr:hypothetical protein BOW39_13150 [Solemya velum gill symbiont]